jgi:phage terminase large subunit-like protein
MLPILYEFPEEVQRSNAWRDPKIWHFVNPNMGHSVTLDRLEADWAQAQEKGEQEIRRWASQHLNVEVGLGLHSNRWTGADLWEAAEEPNLDLEQLLERCEVVVVGIDGGGRDDLFGLAVAGREADTGLWLAVCHAWAIDTALERRKEIAPRLKDFEADGDLTLVKMGQELVDQVAALVVRIRDSGKMPEVGGIGVDAWGMGPLVDALVAAGFDPGDAVAKRAGQIVPIRQGVGLTGTIKTAEFKLGDRMLRHDGSALMAWCVSNARSELRGSNLYISKEAAGSSKIDPLIAMLNAVQLLETGPEAVGGELQVFV